MSSGSMWRHLSRRLVEVGVGKMRFDTLQEPRERRCVCDVGSLVLAGTTGEQAPDTSLAVNDDGARVTFGGEHTGLVIVWEDWPLHRRLVRTVREVLAHKGFSAGSAANGHTCGATALGYIEARFVTLVAHFGAAHLVFLDNASDWQKAVVIRVLEEPAREHGVHTHDEVGKLNVRTWV